MHLGGEVLKSSPQWNRYWIPTVQATWTTFACLTEMANTETREVNFALGTNGKTRYLQL